MRRPALALAAALLLAACSRPATTSPPPASGQVGYVRMDVLVKSHPLYSQLSQYDRSIEALSLRDVSPNLAGTGSDIAQQEAALQRELKAAADRTDRLLKQKQGEYERRESAAIAAALGSANGGAPGAASIAAGLNATAQQQQQSAIAQARTDFGKYRDTVIAQDRAASDALVKTYGERADRLYRAKAAQLQNAESQYSLQIAQNDAGQRLSLRMKLSNLALDSSDRTAASNELAALDKKEADALAAMRSRDQQTLAQYQAQLRTQMRGQLDQQLAALHQRTGAKLKAQSTALSQSLSHPPALSLNVGSGPGRHAAPNELRAKVDALHAQYQAQFDADAKRTIADFNKTRDDLEHRFDQLRSADAGAQAGAQQELASLQKQRTDLYDQIVAQIQRQVRIVAKQRGVAVVVSEVLGPGQGVDLTGDAEKQIESLHE